MTTWWFARVALLLSGLVGLLKPATAAAAPAVPLAPAAAGAPVWRRGGRASAVTVQKGVTYALVGMRLLALDMATGTQWMRVRF